MTRKDEENGEQVDADVLEWLVKHPGRHSTTAVRKGVRKRATWVDAALERLHTTSLSRDKVATAGRGRDDVATQSIGSPASMPKHHVPTFRDAVGRRACRVILRPPRPVPYRGTRCGGTTSEHPRRGGRMSPGNYPRKLLEHVPEAANAPDMSTRAGETTRPAKAQRRRGTFDLLARDAFLEMLTEGRSVAHAARAVGVNRSHLYALRKDDDELREEWDAAVESGLEKLEDMAREAAEEGWFETTFDGDGRPLRRVHRRDPRLALRLRELRRPPATSVDVTVGSGAPIAAEGRAVTTLADLVAFAFEIGQPHLLGLPDSVTKQYRRELNAGSDVVDADAVEEKP